MTPTTTYQSLFKQYQTNTQTQLKALSETFWKLNPEAQAGLCDEMEKVVRKLPQEKSQEHQMLVSKVIEWRATAIYQTQRPAGLASRPTSVTPLAPQEIANLPLSEKITRVVAHVAPHSNRETTIPTTVIKEIEMTFFDGIGNPLNPFTPLQVYIHSALQASFRILFSQPIEKQKNILNLIQPSPHQAENSFALQFLSQTLAPTLTSMEIWPHLDLTRFVQARLWCDVEEKKADALNTFKDQGLTYLHTHLFHRRWEPFALLISSLPDAERLVVYDHIYRALLSKRQFGKCSTILKTHPGNRVSLRKNLEQISYEHAECPIF